MANFSIKHYTFKKIYGIFKKIIFVEASVNSFVEKIALSVKNICSSHPELERLILVVFTILSDNVVQSIFHATAGVLFGVLATENSISEGQIVAKINWIFLVPAIIGYLLVLFAFFICNKYNKMKVVNENARSMSLSHLMDSVYSITRCEVSLNEETFSKSIEQIADVYNGDHNFYAECSRSCKGILDTLNTAFPARKAGFKVEIFVRNIDENSDTYQMVAYAPENGLSPESYLKAFDLMDFRTKCEQATTDINYSDGSFYKVAKKAGVPCHAYPFLSARYDTICLHGREVKDYYVDFHKQNPTKLHIAFPCIVVDKHVLAVIQITCKRENALGYSANLTQHIEELRDTCIAPYAASLALYQAIIRNRDNICAAVNNMNVGGNFDG